MCWYPDGQKLLISYGLRDCEAWLASVHADEVRGLLGGTNLICAAQIRKSPSVHKGLGDGDWVESQTNRALADRDAVDPDMDADADINTNMGTF